MDPYGKPLQGVSLYFWTVPFTMNATTTSDKNGSWAISDTKIVPAVQFVVGVGFKNALN
jgi:hypothetical protein